MNCPRCSQDIDFHEPGPCLDAWVAEAVMGMKMFTVLQGMKDIDDKIEAFGFPCCVMWASGQVEVYTDVLNGRDFCPSTTGDGMLEVMEKLRANDSNDWWFKLEWDSCVWLFIINWNDDDSDSSRQVYASADSAPLAVCRAAVKACVGG